MVRIKESPEDFYVREIKKLDLKEKGRFAYFLLWKRNLTTLEAIRIIAKEFRIPTERVGFAGLKDKEAVTEQFISLDSPSNVKEIERENLKLKFIGFGDKPVSLGEIEGNYFEIVLRNVGKGKKKMLKDRIPFIQRCGFENYFGEQRFGSVKHAEEFIVKHLIRHDYESAMKEYLTSLKNKRLRKALLKSWRNWREFIKLMPKGSQTEVHVVKALMSGKSFKKAFSEIPRNIKLMFSFAYQSYLWNRYLNTFVVRYFKHCTVPFLKWRLAFITEIEDKVFEDIKDLEIPFLGTEYKPQSRKIELIMKEILEEEGLTPSMLRAERVGIKLFNDGLRKAFVFPKDLKVIDEGENFLRLSFILPPGSYATVLLRKLLCAPVES